MNYMTQTLDEVELSVKGINRTSLEKMLYDHPVNHRWRIGLSGDIQDFDLFDFHTMSANWDNLDFRELRELMETEYQVGAVEVEFLKACFEAQPPPFLRLGGSPFFML